ncbi:RNA polymerase subunit sigma, partial [Flavobacterium sp. LBUM151]
ALSKVNGKKEAIIEAEKLNLTDNHFYYSLLGNLYTDLDNKKALQNFENALGLAKTKADKNIIIKNMEHFNT